MRILAVDLTGDVLVALLKFFAAAATASSAMFSEGVHSVMDMATEITLLYGIIASRRPATIQHQFGFGREGYFWNFIASLLILAAGAGVTLHDGIEQIVAPLPLHHEQTDFAVLLGALGIEIGTLFYAVRNGGFPARSGGVRALLASSRDTSSLTVLFTSAASIAGLLLAAIGIGFGRALHEPRLDGLASVAIALVLASIAFAIAARSKAMLIGASASPDEVARLSEIAGKHAAVARINGAMTAHLSASQLLVALSVAFQEGLDTRQIEAAVSDMRERLHADFPEAAFVSINPQNADQYDALLVQRGW
jgi:cation diffusion facilitator family transporter